MNPIIKTIAESAAHAMIKNAGAITRLKDNEDSAMPSAEQALLISKINITQQKLLITYAKHFVNVTINRDSLSRQLDEVIQAATINELEDQFLSLGAPKKMRRELFGTNASEYTNRRDALDLKWNRAGRTLTCDEATEHKIWAAWQSLSHLEERQRYIQLSKDTGLELNIIWNTIQQFTAAPHS